MIISTEKILYLIIGIFSVKHLSYLVPKLRAASNSMKEPLQIWKMFADAASSTYKSLPLMSYAARVMFNLDFKSITFLVVPLSVVSVDLKIYCYCLIW